MKTLQISAPRRSVAPVSTSTGESQHQVPPLLRCRLLQQPNSPGGTAAPRAPSPRAHHGTASPGTLAAGGSAGRSTRGRGGLCDAHAPTPASVWEVTSSQGSQLETPARDRFSVCLLFILITKEQQMLAACYSRYLHVASFSPASPARRGLPSPGDG